MRYGMRLGRNAWVTGGGGVLLVAIVSRLMLAMILGLLAVIAEITKCGVGLALDTRQRSKDVRRSLLKSSIRGCVKRDTEAALSRAPQVWAVYVVGDEFHYGAYPGKGEQLEAQANT